MKQKNPGTSERKTQLEIVALPYKLTFTVLVKNLAQSSMLLNFIGFQFVKKQSNYRKLEVEGKQFE